MTMGKVNEVLKAELPSRLRWFVGGYLACCCTLGCSMLPGFYLKGKVSCGGFFFFFDFRCGRKVRAAAECSLYMGILVCETNVDCGYREEDPGGRERADVPQGGFGSFLFERIAHHISTLHFLFLSDASLEHTGSSPLTLPWTNHST